jgi:flavodoxin
VGKRKVKAIVLCFVMLFFLIICWFIWSFRANKIHYKNNPIQYTSETAEKKALIIYQKGRSDFSTSVATEIASGLKNDGYNVLVNHPGDFLPTDLSEYDVVMFGSPVYVSSLSSVLEEYIKSVNDFGDSKIIYYTTGVLETTEDLKPIQETFDGVKFSGIIKISKADMDQKRVYEKIKVLLDKD